MDSAIEGANLSRGLANSPTAAPFTQRGGLVAGAASLPFPALRPVRRLAGQTVGPHRRLPDRARRVQPVRDRRGGALGSKPAARRSLPASVAPLRAAPAPPGSRPGKRRSPPAAPPPG